MLVEASCKLLTPITMERDFFVSQPFVIADRSDIKQAVVPMEPWPSDEDP